MSPSQSERQIMMLLDERDLSALRWAVPILRGFDEHCGPAAGLREGEATSDVIAGIVARADRSGERPPAIVGHVPPLPWYWRLWELIRRG